MQRITIGLFFSLLNAIQGYLYLVNSTTENFGVCYTDETDRVVALILDLNHASNARGEIGVINYTSISNPKSAYANDCNMFYGCDKWTKNNFSEINSIESPFPLPPVMDQRWNYLNSTIITTNYTTKELYNLNGSSKGFFYISILAHDSAQIIITQKENFSSGHMVVLGGIANKTHFKSLIRYCPEIPRNIYPQNCISYNETKHSHPLLKEGKEWILVLLSFKVNQTYITVTVDANGERILSASINDTKTRLEQPWRVGARTDIGYSAHYKLHEYKTLMPSGRNVMMHTTVDISQDQPSICLEVTYYFFKKASNESITIQIEKQNGNGWKQKFYLEKQQDFHWIKKRSETNLQGAGKYKISISIVPKAVFIGEIRFCKLTAVYVTPAYKGLTDCKFLDGSRPSSLNIARNDNETSLKQSCALCGTLGVKNCTSFEYCDKNRCDCPSGDNIAHSIKQCTNECNESFYGDKCNKPTSNGGAYLIYTEICIDGCFRGYLRSPKCNKELLRFKTEPNVKNIGTKTCVIDLLEAYNELQNSYDESELKKWNHTEIQLLKGEEWETVTKLRNHNQSVVLKNLTPLTEYRVRALIVEKDGQNTTHNLNENSFKTLPCVPRVTVTDDLEIHINVRNDEEEHPCYFHSIGINCGPNSSFSISYDEIVQGKAKNLKMEDINCNITVYTSDGIAISVMRQTRHIPQIISLFGLIIIANFIATILINIVTLFLFTRRMNILSNNTNIEQHCVTYRSSDQEAVSILYSNIG